MLISRVVLPLATLLACLISLTVAQEDEAQVPLAEELAGAGIQIEPEVPVLPGEELQASAKFMETNPFGHVINGLRNAMLLLVENRSDKNVTIVSASGSFHHPETGALWKNTTTIPFKIVLPAKTKSNLPYGFNSEIRTGDIKLKVWVDYSVEGGASYRAQAYDSIVQVVEPEGSWFDFQLYSAYLFVLAAFGGLGYLAYTTYFPSAKKGRSKRSAVKKAVAASVQDVSSPVGTVKASGAGGYEEEWIPDHHFKRKASKKGKQGGALSSGDEKSGTESGREKKGKAKRA